MTDDLDRRIADATARLDARPDPEPAPPLPPAPEVPALVDVRLVVTETGPRRPDGSLGEVGIRVDMAGQPVPIQAGLPILLDHVTTAMAQCAQAGAVTWTPALWKAVAHCRRAFEEIAGQAAQAKAAEAAAQLRAQVRANGS